MKTKKLQFYIFMLFYSWNKSKEERTMKKETKTRNKKKAKEERQEARNKDKFKERQRKRNRKGGGQKRLREEEREKLKINQKNALFRGKTGLFYKKQRKEPKRKQKATKKQKNKNKTKKNKKRKKKRKTRKTKNTQKWAFQLSEKIFLLFGWVSKISLFWQLGPKSAHPKNTTKIGVSGPFFWKADMRHETAIFGPKKPKFINSSYHFFLPVFFSFNNRKHKKLLKSLFLLCFSKPKKENFQILYLKHWKLKNPIFAPFFWKRLF